MQTDFSFVVGLKIYRKTRPGIFKLCTGSFIAPDVIVTAAHCLCGVIREIRVSQWSLVRLKQKDDVDVAEGRVWEGWLKILGQLRTLVPIEQTQRVDKQKQLQSRLEYLYRRLFVSFTFWNTSYLRSLWCTQKWYVSRLCTCVCVCIIISVKVSNPRGWQNIQLMIWK